MNTEFHPWDAALFLTHDIVPSYLAGSWRNSMEDKSPRLFIQAINSAARYMKLSEIADQPSIREFIGLLQALGVKLDGGNESALADAAKIKPLRIGATARRGNARAKASRSAGTATLAEA